MQEETSLEEKTSMFWLLSKSYNGQSAKSIPFTKANNIVRGILSTTAPKRPLAKQTEKIHRAIIHGSAENVSASPSSPSTSA